MRLFLLLLRLLILPDEPNCSSSSSSAVSREVDKSAEEEEVNCFARARCCCRVRRALGRRVFALRLVSAFDDADDNRSRRRFTEAVLGRDNDEDEDSCSCLCFKTICSSDSICATVAIHCQNTC